MSFDYKAIDDEDLRFDLRRRADRIRYELAKDASDAIVEIGTYLQQAKDALPENLLESWCRIEFSWSLEQAEQLIGVAANFGMESSFSPTFRFEALGSLLRRAKEYTAERTQAQAVLNPAPLTAHGGDRKSTNQRYYNNVDSSEGRGDDPEYLTARIARDRPDILNKMQRGEYPSARAAGIAAGIVKPRIQLTVGHSTTAQTLAGAMVEKLDPDFLRELTKILHEALF